MPKGIPNKKKIEPIKETPIVERKEEAKAPVVLKEEVKVAPQSPKLDPLGPGQKYFETPEGEIIIGEETKDRVWSRRMNGGKGGWANPKR